MWSGVWDGETEARKLHVLPIVDTYEHLHPVRSLAMGSTLKAKKQHGRLT